MKMKFKNSLLIFIILLTNIFLFPVNEEIDLINAIKHNDGVEVVKVLNSGLNPNYFDNKGITPLTYSLIKGNKDIFKKLLEYGAEINFLNKKGNTIIHEVSWRGKLDFLIILKEKGANLDIANKNGLTPLHLSIKFEQLEIFKYLLKMDIDINKVNNDGQTALIMICSKRNFNLISNKPMPFTEIDIAIKKYFIEELLKKGAIKHIEDIKKKKAIDYLKENGLWNLVKLLAGPT